MLKLSITFKVVVMGYALTTKSQVTVPKAVRLALGIGPGQEVDYEVQANGKVLMFPVRTVSESTVNPFLKWRGIGILKKPTEEILRETRGEESMQ
jgi:antitoxin PrlF